MTKEERALIYFKDLRERKAKDYSSVLNTARKDSVVYGAVSAEIEIYDTVIKALGQESCEDVMAIHTQGLDQGIRCAMCTNSMKSDRGCNGSCMVDDEMYKKVMETINKQMFELPISDDCVSRQAVLDNAYAYGNGLEPEGYCVNIEDIQALPPVTPTQNWIPVSERLPKLDVNINVYEKKNPIMVSKPVYISYRLDGRDYVCPIPCILHSNGHWYNDADSLKDWVQLDDYDGGADLPISLEVTAWMPLTEPYKAKMEAANGN